mmetsp:Transcript_22843/g.63426  ORF Transcript_22843/g.63426 Transcript_22843/m.63426 type:complete len:80 (+) Transcript_22843:656-895(+)
MEVTDIAVSGVQTPNCIRGTSMDALALDYSVSVLSDACAAKTPEVHQANLHDMRMMEIQILSVAEWTAAVRTKNKNWAC